MKDPIFVEINFFKEQSGIHLIPNNATQLSLKSNISFFLSTIVQTKTNLLSSIILFFSPRSVRRSGAYGVHKNKHCEEWNNLREDTHKTWTFNSFTTPRIIAAIPVFSVVMYSLIKREEEMIDAKAAASGTHENLTMKPAKKVKYL